MKMLRKIGLTSVMVVCASTTFASEWVTLASTQREAWFIDRQSIRVDGALHQFWSKTVYGAPYPYLQGQHLGYAIMHWAVNCENRTVATGSMKAYSTDGTVISSTSPSMDFNEPAPDSNAEFFVNASCRGG